MKLIKTPEWTPEKTEGNMKLHELAKYEPINGTEKEKVSSIKRDIAKGIFSCPPILLYEDEEVAITGSHRIQACSELLQFCEKNFWVEQTEAIYDYEIPTFDVSAILNEYYENHSHETFSEFEYDALEKYFHGTDIESIVEDNPEYH